MAVMAPAAAPIRSFLAVIYGWAGLEPGNYDLDWADATQYVRAFTGPGVDATAGEAPALLRTAGPVLVWAAATGYLDDGLYSWEVYDQGDSGFDVGSPGDVAIGTSSSSALQLLAPVVAPTDLVVDFFNGAPGPINFSFTIHCAELG